MSPHFINDKKLSRAVYEDVHVLFSEKKISNLQDIKTIFDQLAKENIGSLVIVCEDIEDSMLGVLVANKQLGRFNSLVIRATGPMLQDVEGVTGAKAISDSNGVTFANFKIEHLGKLKKIVCDANKTLFMGDGIQAKIRAAELESRA